jgi:hypothetical protein
MAPWRAWLSTGASNAGIRFNRRVMITVTSSYRPRPGTADDVADRHQQQRPRDVEQSDRAGDGASRPAPGGGQRLQVDAGAKQAEGIGECCPDQADRDNTLTVVEPAHGLPYHAVSAARFGSGRSESDWLD